MSDSAQDVCRLLAALLSVVIFILVLAICGG